MADPVSTSPSDVWGMAKAHPYAVAGGIAALVLLIWYFESASSSSSATTSSGAATSNDPTGDAAAISAAQIAANAATAQGAQTLQGTQSTNDMLTTLGLANLTANANATTGSAYYNSLSEISASNSATAIASLEAGDFEQVANDQTISNEFGNLSALLATYADGYQGIVSNGYTASGATSNTNGFGGGNWGSKAGTPTNASPLGPATYQLPTDVVSATTDTSAWGRVKGWFKGAGQCFDNHDGIGDGGTDCGVAGGARRRRLGTRIATDHYREPIRLQYPGRIVRRGHSIARRRNGRQRQRGDCVNDSRECQLGICGSDMSVKR